MPRPTKLDPCYVNRRVVLPYELKVEEIEQAVALCAKIDQADWSFSGRTGTSRRTPTASITATGVEKLRNNFLYRLPDVGIGRHRTILAQP